MGRGEQRVALDVVQDEWRAAAEDRTPSPDQAARDEFVGIDGLTMAVGDYLRGTAGAIPGRVRA